jgi:hypothetical protein
LKPPAISTLTRLKLLFSLTRIQFINVTAFVDLREDFRVDKISWLVLGKRGCPSVK